MVHCVQLPVRQSVRPSVRPCVRACVRACVVRVYVFVHSDVIYYTEVPSGCKKAPLAKPGWQLLIRQTTPKYLNPASKWLSVNPTKPKDPNYSILNTLDNKCKDDKGKFDTNPKPQPRNAKP